MSLIKIFLIGFFQLKNGDASRRGYFKIKLLM